MQADWWLEKNVMYNYFLAAPLSLWDFSSPTKDGTQTLGSESVESQPLTHQGTSEKNL